MGGSGSKSPEKTNIDVTDTSTKVVENSSGFHVFELHLPTMSYGLVALVALGAAAYAVYRWRKRRSKNDVRKMLQAHPFMLADRSGPPLLLPGLPKGLMPGQLDPRKWGPNAWAAEEGRISEVGSGADNVAAAAFRSVEDRIRTLERRAGRHLVGPCSTEADDADVPAMSRR